MLWYDFTFIESILIPLVVFGLLFIELCVACTNIEKYNTKEKI